MTRSEILARILQIVTFFLVLGCSESLKYSKMEMYRIGKKEDSSLSLKLPDSMTEGVSCKSYGPGCLGAHIVEVSHLQAIFVEFDTKEHALIEARKVNAYTARNWLLDDVVGEPMLEKFVKKAYGATKALPDQKSKKVISP